MDLIQELTKAKQNLNELESKLADAGVLSDPKKLKTTNEAYVRTREIVEAGDAWKAALASLEHAKTALTEEEDADLRELAREEKTKLEEQLPSLEAAFSQALIPPDPMDGKNIVVEIRAGTGGDEAALFAGDLLRMYTRYAEEQKWRVSLVSSSQNDLGGAKEVIFLIEGKNVYSALKHESGVHRVQRVPMTEKQGRVHTSTATVAVMPEAEEVDIKINPKDLDIITSTAGGHGGQSVNTTYSAIRITHKPSGIMVQCQDERSQTQNREKAMQVLRARLFAMEQERLSKERSDERRGQVGTGERSEKIRTYNYPQDRITDHRVNQNFHNIEHIMDGGLDEIVGKLSTSMGITNP